MVETGRGFIVEFTALPGSGKSTLSHGVAIKLRRAGHVVTQPSDEFGQVIPPGHGNQRSFGYIGCSDKVPTKPRSYGDIRGRHGVTTYSLTGHTGINLSGQFLRAPTSNRPAL